MSVRFMSDEARRYYDGGKRKLIGGVPCRVAAHASKAPGKDNIAKLIANGAAIEAGDLPDAPRFRFVPIHEINGQAAPLYQGKPSARGSYSYSSRYRSSWWKPAGISAAPYSVLSLTDTPADEADAKGAWRDGDPKLLRQWLADTADERRATWAAIDAAKAVASFARALGQPLTFDEHRRVKRYAEMCGTFAAHGFDQPTPPPARHEVMLAAIEAGRARGLYAKPSRLAA